MKILTLTYKGLEMSNEPGTVEHLCAEVSEKFGSIPAMVLYRFVQSCESEYTGVMPLSADELVGHLSGVGHDDDGEIGKFIVGYFGGSGSAYVPYLENENKTTDDWKIESWTTTPLS